MNRLSRVLVLRGQMALPVGLVILRRCTIHLVMSTIVGIDVRTSCDKMFPISISHKIDGTFWCSCDVPYSFSNKGPCAGLRSILDHGKIPPTLLPIRNWFLQVLISTKLTPQHPAHKLVESSL